MKNIIELLTKSWKCVNCCRVAEDYGNGADHFLQYETKFSSDVVTESSQTRLFKQPHGKKDPLLEKEIEETEELCGRILEALKKKRYTIDFYFVGGDVLIVYKDLDRQQFLMHPITFMGGSLLEALGELAGVLYL